MTVRRAWCESLWMGTCVAFAALAVGGCAAGDKSAAEVDRSSGDDGPGASPSDDTAGPGTSSDTSSDTSVDTGSGPAARHCPDDMVPVPAESPEFCIDRYEASESSDRSVLQSVAGVEPLTGVSFLDARALCENTPVVIDGETVGWRRMATLREWRDAADGVVGEGGATYPTGETWPEDDCAVMTAEEEQVYATLQPTGSFPDCVSPFGTYDQLGNAWEWADPQLDASIGDFLARTADNGVELSVDDAGQMTWVSGSTDNLYFVVPGLFAEVRVDEAGVVVAGDVTWQAELPFDFVGYLVAGSRGASSGRVVMVPIEIAQPPEDATTAETATMTVRWSEDGAPITAKVGCAYYTGGPSGCGNNSWFFGHPPEFAGTIGVRCAADPAP